MKGCLAAIVGLALFAPACATDPAPRGATEVDMTQQAEGTRVRVTGVAQNAKLGAVVVSERMTVYCLDRQEWPPDLVGQQVTVSGIVERTDDFKAEVNEKGEISQGSAGGDLVIRRSTLEKPERESGPPGR